MRTCSLTEPSLSLNHSKDMGGGSESLALHVPTCLNDCLTCRPATLLLKQVCLQRDSSIVHFLVMSVIQKNSLVLVWECRRGRETLLIACLQSVCVFVSLHKYMH